VRIGGVAMSWAGPLLCYFAPDMTAVRRRAGSCRELPAAFVITRVHAQRRPEPVSKSVDWRGMLTPSSPCALCSARAGSLGVADLITRFWDGSREFIMAGGGPQPLHGNLPASSGVASRPAFIRGPAQTAPPPPSFTALCRRVRAATAGARPVHGVRVPGPPFDLCAVPSCVISRVPYVMVGKTLHP